jgi:sulfatase maturation enzyme AslB (radical SAM superfamily)
MTINTAKKSIDWIFDNIPDGMSGVEIGFIGGEPLLEFELIKDIISYTCSKQRSEKFIFYATTNGVLLTEEIKKWCFLHRDCFVLGLSLDGARETHNHNRSNSFDNIDIDFFLKTWPNQGIKMTLSEYSLKHLARNIKYVHSLGFKEINGVNLFEGTFNWGNDDYIKILVPQLKELVAYYVENDMQPLDQMFDKHINFCEVKDKKKRNWCGIGNGTNFFDVDGQMFPCPFVTPMTFSYVELSTIMTIDFTNADNFIDIDCFNNCYIYPICPTCAGANYFTNKTFKERDKRRCRIQKLIALFIADLQAKRIRKNPHIYDNNTLYHTIEAIKSIRTLYLAEFQKFF